MKRLTADFMQTTASWPVYLAWQIVNNNYSSLYGSLKRLQSLSARLLRLSYCKLRAQLYLADVDCVAQCSALPLARTHS
jgi:hypothetical protein